MEGAIPMPDPFIDQNSSLLHAELLRPPIGLPHGPVAPPERVRQIVAQEEVRLLRERQIVPTPEARQRLVNDLTLQYYFDRLGHEVLYRSTPAGPEVLAVGLDEIIAVRERMPLEEQLTLHTWLP
jgi:hypothetical protein